jgi:hypothetical protein
VHSTHSMAFPEAHVLSSKLGFSTAAVQEAPVGQSHCQEPARRCGHAPAKHLTPWPPSTPPCICTPHTHGTSRNLHQIDYLKQLIWQSQPSLFSKNMQRPATAGCPRPIAVAPSKWSGGNLRPYSWQRCRASCRWPAEMFSRYL